MMCVQTITTCVFKRNIYTKTALIERVISKGNIHELTDV